MDLKQNVQLITTTELGKQRISRNLKLDSDTDPLEYCKQKIISSSDIIIKGKNWYVSDDECIITVNRSSLGVITAHPVKRV